MQAKAIFGQTLATNLIAVTRDPSELTAGWWAVLQTFDGDFYGFRFNQITDDSRDFLTNYQGTCTIAEESWSSSLSQVEYEAGVEKIRDYISQGWVYQTNYCRVLSANLSTPFDCLALLKSIRAHNPAPFASGLFIPQSESKLTHDIRIASASPELFLRRSGDEIQSSPIKGTAGLAQQMLDKDSAENVMIVDLIRNDISHVCLPGSVKVPELMRLENHPGLTHLVSDVTGQLKPNTSWSQILKALMPPGSVSGAPKSSSLKVIDELEPVSREVYCGYIGWIDVDNSQAQLAVAIRTFWQSFSDSNVVKFGTGAGITYSSDPRGEWRETELKASHLLKVASGSDH